MPGNCAKFLFNNGEGTGGFHPEPSQEHHQPAYNQEHQENQQDDPFSATTEEEPFLYYEESHVQDSIN